MFAKLQYNMKSNTIVCHQRDVPVMFCFVSFKWTDLPTENIHRTLAEIHWLKLCCADSHELLSYLSGLLFQTQRDKCVWRGWGWYYLFVCSWKNETFFYLLSQGLHTFRLLDLVFIPFRLNFWFTSQGIVSPIAHLHRKCLSFGKIPPESNKNSDFANFSHSRKPSANGGGIKG